MNDHPLYVQKELKEQYYIMGMLVKLEITVSRWIFWLNEHNEKLLAADTTKALHHIHVKQ